MSEFLAEAQVLVRPNTVRFRAELEAELLAATRGIGITVPVTGFNAAALSAASAQLAAATSAATTAVTTETAALTNLQRAELQAAGTTAALATSQDRLSLSTRQARQGLLATALTTLGIRGATLAASSSFLIAAGAATTLFRSLNLAGQVESQLNVFQATTQATAEQMERVSAVAKELGRDLTLPGVSAADAVDAILELARAGLSVEESLAGARGVLQLATAAQISNGEAARLAANALNAFNLQGEDTVRVADLLAAAANEAQGSISDMGLALQQSSAVARQLGVDVDDTVALLTILQQAGIRASDAGTSLRVAFTRLIAPGEEAQSLLKRFNIELRDAAGNLRVDVFAQLGQALSELGRQEQARVLFRIFGQDAQRAAAILAREGIPALNDVQRALERTGVAAEVAGARTEGLSGSAENLKNQFAALGLEIGQLASPIAELGIDVTAEFFGLLADSISNTREGIASFSDDADQLAQALRDISEESGFNQFLSDVAEGARLIESDIQRASAATDAFFGDLLGLGGSAENAATKIRKLTQEEVALAESMRDANLGLAEQIARLERLAQQAERAALTPAQVLGQVAGLAEGTVRAQISGDRTAVLEQLRRRSQVLEDRLQEEVVQRRPALRRQLQRELLSVLREIESIENEIVAEEERHARALEQSARERQQAREDAFRAQLERFDIRRQQAENAIIIAQNTASLQDDLNKERELRRILLAQIATLRRQARNSRDAASALADAQRELAEAEANIADLIRQRRRDAIERQRESLQLDVEIARTTGNVAAQRRALEAEIAFLQERIRATRRGSLQRKRLILELRQAQKELRELGAEQKTTGKTFQEVAFEFLQTQQGFAANLFGNLIPAGATGGLVGVSSAAAAQRPTAEAARTAAIGEARERGFTIGQGDTTNELLRRILRALENLNGRAGHPEARYQRATTSSTGDFFPV